MTQKCDPIVREECSMKMRTECDNICREQCEDKDKRVCMTVPNQECKEKPVENCIDVPKSNCRKVRFLPHTTSPLSFLELFYFRCLANDVSIMSVIRLPHQYAGPKPKPCAEPNLAKSVPMW